MLTLFNLAFCFFQYGLLNLYRLYCIEAQISDFFEFYFWSFLVGETIASHPLFIEWVPWILEKTSVMVILWIMNMQMQWAFLTVVNFIPVQSQVDFIPEFSPPNKVATISRHLWQHNPITFVYRQSKRLLLWIRIFYHEFTSAYISEMIESALVRYADVRHELLKFGDKIPIRRNHPGHSHPISAAYRSAVNEYMKDVVTTAGYVPYSVSSSASDNTGNRFFYNMKDLAIPYKNDLVPDNAALIFTDVDYYANMKHWLLLKRPIMMYTFVPTTLAGNTEEYSFRTIGNYVEYQVRGGAGYSHMLWDYKGDHMTVTDPSDSSVITYAVEQRVIEGDPDHRIVLLLPTARVPYPQCNYLTGHVPLERKNFGSGEYKHMFNPLTKILSLAVDGAWSSVEINVDVYNAIRERIRAKSGMPLVSDVEKYLSQQGDIDAVLKAPLLFNLMDTEFKPNVVSTSLIQVSYQPFNPAHKAEIISEDGKPKGRAVSNQILDKPALMPTKSISSDISSVLGRVEKPRNSVDPPAYYKQLKREFVQALIGPLSGTGASIATEEVAARQNKAAQRNRFENAKHYFSEHVVGPLKTFIKAEGYAAPNDPRTITQVPQAVTTLLSEYTYSFKEAILKKQPWYGPGKTPMETIDRLAELTTRLGVITTDFSRFDGSISEFLQSVAKCCYMNYFSASDRRRLGRLYKAIFTKTAFTECGLKYDAGCGTRSGSPITTDANTIINAYVMFCALRKLNLNVQDAMKLIGLVCGDDGYMANRDGLGSALKEVCKDLGLDLKPEEHTEGPYPYLGRFFCDPATTDSSFQDPMRTLAKIHLSAKSSIPDSQARVNKSIGYLTTDSITPIIGEYCRLSLKKADGDDPKTVYSGKNFSSEEQYKITLAWPQRPSDKDLIDQQVAKLCRLEALELKQMVERFSEYKTYKDVPILFEAQRLTKIVAAVEHDLEYPEGTHTEQKPSNESEPTRPTGSNNQAKRSHRSRNMEDSQRSPSEDGKPQPVKSTGRASTDRNRLERRRPEGKRTDSGPNGRNPRSPTKQRPPRNDRGAVASKPTSGPSTHPRKTEGGRAQEADNRSAKPLTAVTKNGLGQGSRT
jgi:hypothetical protein